MAAKKARKSSLEGGFSEQGEPFQGRSLVSADATECAHYIADLSLELRNLARRNGLKFLAQLLEMAFQEAFLIAHRTEPTEADLRRASQARETS
jgi:hypothetical protein